MRTRPRIVLLLLLCLLLPVAGCGGGGDAASALANRLSDAFDFEDGEQVEGQAPEGNADPASAPQIDTFDAPEQVQLAESFLLTMTTAFARPEEVTGAVVRVKGASSHILVDRPARQTDGAAWQVELAGLVRSDPELRGEWFTVEVGLRLTSGTVGGYRAWRLSIADLPDTEYPAGVLLFDGGQTSTEPAPAGDRSAAAPQIAFLSGPAVLDPGRPFEVGLFTEWASLTELNFAVVAPVGGEGHYLSPLVLPEAAVRDLTGRHLLMRGTLSPDAPACTSFVFLIALKTAGGRIGDYQYWGFETDCGLIDGDTAVDGDTTADGDTTVDGDTAIDGDDETVEVADEEQPDGDTGIPTECVATCMLMDNCGFLQPEGPFGSNQAECELGCVEMVAGLSEAEIEALKRCVGAATSPSLDCQALLACLPHGPDGDLEPDGDVDGDQTEIADLIDEELPDGDTGESWPPSEPWWSGTECNLPACDEQTPLSFDPSGLWRRYAATVWTDCDPMLRYGDPSMEVGSLRIDEPIPYGATGQCIRDYANPEILSGVGRDNTVIYCIGRQEQMEVFRLDTSWVTHIADFACGQATVYLSNLPEWLGPDCRVELGIYLRQDNGQCVPGEFACLDGGTIARCEQNTEAGPAWGEPIPCGEQAPYCQMNCWSQGCVACLDGMRGCDGNAPRVCEGGAWQPGTPCGEGSYCNPGLGLCLPDDECVNQQSRCVGTGQEAVEYCYRNEFGQTYWDVPYPCQEPYPVCSGPDPYEAGCYECVWGTARCIDTTASQPCIDGYWSGSESCLDGEECNPATGRCGPPPQGFLFTPGSVEFGQVGIGDGRVYPLALVNMGPGTVTVTGVDFSAASSSNFSLEDIYQPVKTSVEYVLYPYEELTVELFYLPTAEAPDVGALEVTVENAQNGPLISIPLSGTGVAPQLVYDDTASGLMWQQNPPAEEMYRPAQIAYCDGLTWGGLDDWRLPSIDELRTLILGCQLTGSGGPCGVTEACALESCWNMQACSGCTSGGGPNGCYRPAGLSGPCSRLWSSTDVNSSSEQGWYVDFSLGKITYTYGSSYAFNVRCVRDGGTQTR